MTDYYDQLIRILFYINRLGKEDFMDSRAINSLRLKIIAARDFA